jgi:hypothetical protein
MKLLGSAALAITVMLLAFGVPAKGGSGKRIVLPSPALLGCRSDSCSQVWQKRDVDADAIFPRQVIIDVGDRGVMALYDKSISLESLEASINEHYGRWAFPDNGNRTVKLWRVESDQFSIQLSAEDDCKRVIYLKFR